MGSNLRETSRRLEQAQANYKTAKDCSEDVNELEAGESKAVRGFNFSAKGNYKGSQLKLNRDIKLAKTFTAWLAEVTK
jgi:hypothetical protein